MYFSLLFLFGIIECKRFILIETEGHDNPKGKSHKMKIKRHHSKQANGLDYSGGGGEGSPLVDPLPPDQEWKDKCSLQTPCSEDSCMIQKDIPGCRGSIKLLCTGGCLNILKVRDAILKEKQLKDVWWP